MDRDYYYHSVTGFDKFNMTSLTALDRPPSFLERINCLLTGDRG